MKRRSETWALSPGLGLRKPSSERTEGWGETERAPLRPTLGERGLQIPAERNGIEQRAGGSVGAAAD